MLRPDYSGRKCLPFWCWGWITLGESAYPSGAEARLFREKVPTRPVLRPDNSGRKCLPFRRWAQIIPGESAYPSDVEPRLFREKVPTIQVLRLDSGKKMTTLPALSPDYSGRKCLPFRRWARIFREKVPTLPVLRPDYSGRKWSVPWLLTLWLLASPGYLQPSYKLCWVRVLLIPKFHIQL